MSQSPYLQRQLIVYVPQFMIVRVLFGVYYTAQIAGPAAILSWFRGGLVILLALCFLN